MAPAVGLGSSVYPLGSTSLPQDWLSVGHRLHVSPLWSLCGVQQPPPSSTLAMSLYLYSIGNPLGAFCSLIRPILGRVLIALCFHPRAREGILLINLDLSHFSSLLESASRTWAVREVVKQNLGKKELVV